MNAAVRQRNSQRQPADGPDDPQYVAVQARGTIALPAGLRRRLHLDEPGAQVAIVEREDGVIELRPALPVPADQRWFWTDRWQAMEREVDAHVAAGRVIVLDGPDALFDHLDAVAGTAEPGDPDAVRAPDPAAT
jgi:bifunctional DNA-binding transcriptional regulator/antitoxin component of YhaV-PrlF toxin-antitoxin module